MAKFDAGKIKVWQIRPKQKGPKRYRSYCTQCHTEYNRNRRVGRVETLLTPDEWELIRGLRRAGADGQIRTAPRGKHKAS